PDLLVAARGHDLPGARGERRCFRPGGVERHDLAADEHQVRGLGWWRAAPQDGGQHGQAQEGDNAGDRKKHRPVSVAGGNKGKEREEKNGGEKKKPGPSSGGGGILRRSPPDSS